MSDPDLLPSEVWWALEQQLNPEELAAYQELQNQLRQASERFRNASSAEKAAAGEEVAQRGRELMNELRALLIKYGLRRA